MKARGRKTRRRGVEARIEVVRNRRGESTRAAILTAAHRLLQREGISALSIGRVAKAAGITRSSIYHQFRGRDEFLLHLIAESLRRLQRERNRPRRGRSAVDRFLDEAEAGFRGDPGLFRMFYRLVFDDGWRRPELTSLLRGAYRYRTDRLAAALARDRITRSHGEAETLATVLVAALDGLYARRLVDAGPAELRRALRALGDLVRPPAERRAKRTGQR